jgi:hypothetical protein
MMACSAERIVPKMADNQLEALVGLVTRLDCDVKCELLDSQVRSHLTCVPDLDPPDLHVFGTPGSGSGSLSQVWIHTLLSSSKISKINLDSFCFVTSFGLFIFKK